MEILSSGGTLPQRVRRHGCQAIVRTPSSTFYWRSRQDDGGSRRQGSAWLTTILGCLQAGLSPCCDLETNRTGSVPDQRKTQEAWAQCCTPGRGRHGITKAMLVGRNEATGGVRIGARNAGCVRGVQGTRLRVSSSTVSDTQRLLQH